MISARAFSRRALSDLHSFLCLAFQSAVWQRELQYNDTLHPEQKAVGARALHVCREQRSGGGRAVSGPVRAMARAPRAKPATNSAWSISDGSSPQLAPGGGACPSARSPLPGAGAHDGPRWAGERPFAVPSRARSFSGRAVPLARSALRKACRRRGGTSPRPWRGCSC